MDIQTAIARVIDKQDLSADDMQSVMHSIMHGEASNAQIGGFLVGLRMKGETVEEITAAASVMRELACRVNVDHAHLVDIVGTGGDGSNTFNISTTSAFVIAAAGAKVAKHNNRSVSSKSGSADVLEAAGVKLELTPEQVAECVDKIGVGFMFAPLHHAAMKHAVGPRRELATRTIFNLLGPLTNPAEVPNQLMGVFDGDLIVPLAEVLQKLGSKHVMVVHSEDGMDEISISAPTNVAELNNGTITGYQISPEQFGLSRSSLSEITVNDPSQSLEMMHAVLDNQAGACKDIVLLNAGAAIYTAGLSPDLGNGIRRADEVISNGIARQKLNELVRLTNELPRLL